MVYSNFFIVTDWLSSIPMNCFNGTAVYQPHTGKIMLFIETLVHIFDLTSFQLTFGYINIFYLYSVFNQKLCLQFAIVIQVKHIHFIKIIIIGKLVSVRLLSNHMLIYPIFFRNTFTHVIIIQVRRRKIIFLGSISCFHLMRLEESQ